MKHLPSPRHSRAARPAPSGQAMIEYMIVTSAVGIVLFVPNPLTGNMAPADYVARAVRTFFRAYSFLVSVS